MSKELLTEINSLDDNFSRNTVQLTYPSVEILDFGEELPTVLDSLEEGPLPVIVQVGEELRLLPKAVAFSGITLFKLLEVYKLRIHVDQQKSVVISNSTELMEVLRWMV